MLKKIVQHKNQEITNIFTFTVLKFHTMEGAKHICQGLVKETLTSTQLNSDHFLTLTTLNHKVVGVLADSLAVV